MIAKFITYYFIILHNKSTQTLQLHKTMVPNTTQLFKITQYIQILFCKIQYLKLNIERGFSIDSIQPCSKFYCVDT